jgi:hypothetical protein
MNSMKISMLVATLGLATVIAITGCKREKPPEKPASPPASPTPQPTAAAGLPANLFLDKAPQGVVELAAAKKTAKVGDEIVLRGRVAGQKDPLAAKRAIVTLLDNAIPTCEKSPMDKCPTPWDACCEPADVLLANTATIQVVDASGRPLKTGLRGVNGIEPLKELIVVGKVKGQEANTLVVDATSIYVKG